jgi:hypothetical protein
MFLIFCISSWDEPFEGFLRTAVMQGRLHRHRVRRSEVTRGGGMNGKGEVTSSISHFILAMYVPKLSLLPWDIHSEPIPTLSKSSHSSPPSFHVIIYKPLPIMLNKHQTNASG